MKKWGIVVFWLWIQWMNPADYGQWLHSWDAPVSFETIEECLSAKVGWSMQGRFYKILCLPEPWTPLQIEESEREI